MRPLILLLRVIQLLTVMEYRFSLIRFVWILVLEGRSIDILNLFHSQEEEWHLFHVLGQRLVQPAQLFVSPHKALSLAVSHVLTLTAPTSLWAVLFAEAHL